MKRVTTEMKIGIYGTEELPVYSVDGEERVAQEYFLDAHGNPDQVVCQSGGCGYCDGDHAGCRFAPKNSGRATDWFF